MNRYPQIARGKVQLVHRSHVLAADANVSDVKVGDCDVIMVHCSVHVESWQQKRTEKARFLSETGKSINRDESCVDVWHRGCLQGYRECQFLYGRYLVKHGES